jgi:type I restriction enzyme R subunit
LQEIKNAALPDNDSTLLFRVRYKYVISYFKELEQEELIITEQDKLLYNLCRKDRLLDMMYHYTLFDDGEKKIARYQQYFAVKQTLQKISVVQEDGKRKGGVIWHTQGSGKSLTMVMLAQLIAMHPNIKNPKIILVTDRIDLDDQITGTFKKCNKPVENAVSGKDLVTLIESKSDAIITTIINKFEAAVRYAKEPFKSPDIFILVDEGHRSQYGTFNVMMQRIFSNACFIAFTGTPLMKREKSTALKFGGLIDVYSIIDAVEDKAVVPLLYEGRHNIMEVNEKPLDTFFDRVSEPLTPYGKTALKKKFSTRNAVVQSMNFIENTAWDITKHFVDNIQGTGFKGQLVAPNKFTALRYREVLKEIGKVSAELLISAPDNREGEDDAFEVKDDKVKAFYNAMMDKYGNKDKYEKSIINSFKKQDYPEIIIVVDKLLTGFDAPRNQVLYLTRQLKEHTLLQAIARVNRLHPGKDYGYIIDYYGNLENLDSALTTYSGLEEFDEEELAGTLTNINVEIEKLPQAHSELWDIFKEVRNKYDEPAYEELLSDEAKRHSFYEKLSIYARLLKLALSSYEFSVKTPEKQIEKYKKDAHFFLSLRVSVKRRYSDDIDFKEYETQVQKLIDKHITSDGAVLKITQLVNIFDKEERQAEVEKLTGKAAKADHIASRTIKAINVRMNEDPVFYKRLSQLIKETIEDYHRQRISEAEYLAKAKDFENTFIHGKKDNIPDRIKDNNAAIAFYNLAAEDWKEGLSGKANNIEIAAEIGEGIDTVMKDNIFEKCKKVIDWQNNIDIEGRIKIQIDDFLFDTKSKYDLDISFEQFDQLIAECLKVAKVKYN